MAKNTTEAEVVITMNGQQAKQVIADLTEQYDKLTAAAVEAKKQGNEALGNELNKQAKAVKKTLGEVTTQTKTFEDVLKNLNSKSLKELKTAAKDLRAQINKLEPGTKQFIERSEQLRQVNTRIHSLEEAFRAVTVEEKKAVLSLSSLTDGFNKYFGIIGAGIASITGVSLAFRKCAEEVAKLDDVYSDVMKTTGLTRDEVVEMNEELKSMDTRTSREQLNLLARDAGKLGITGKENILGFVRAADKIQVALGEDLGEGAIRNLGKIADVLGYTGQMGIEKSLLSIGSAVNAVGQASTASEAYLVDFTQRLAGVAAQAGISGADIIGFASGLDQSAMKVEMAATAFQTFITKVYEDPAKFAQYAKMSMEDFAKLMETDANEAIITVLKNLQDEGGFSALIPIFKDMGVDGARATSVLAAMASNLSAITDAQALANVEFAKATSLTQEFDTKNNNMQASLDKARKSFADARIELGEKLNPIMLKTTNATTYLIKALAKYGKEIAIVIGVVGALTLALKAKVIWQKIVATWNATLRTGSLALAAAQALLTGNITRATAAWTMMNTAMKASVIGVVTAAIAGLIIVIEKLVKKQREANTYKEKSLELDRKIEEAGEKEIINVNRLKDIVHDQNKTYFERNKALQELKKLVPEYQASLTKEGSLINDNVDALDSYIEKLKQVAVQKAMQEEADDIAKRYSEAIYNQQQHQKQLDDALSSYTGDAYMGNTAGSAAAMIAQELLAADQIILDKIGRDSQELSDKMKMLMDSGLLDFGGEETDTGGGGDNGSPATVIDKKIDELKAARERLREQLDLIRDNENWKSGHDGSGYATQANPYEDPKASESFWEQIYAKRDSIVEGLENNAMQKEFDLEMRWAEKLHEQGLLSEEDYEKRKLQLKLNYASQVAEQVGQITNQASNLVSAIQSAETAQLEAEYQARLTAAGDNAEQRAAIEADYEQQKLDIQKKYADADMVINIAKTTANGAVAAIKAYSEGGPFAGPVLAALIAATTAAEIATIIAQRNAIMNTSVSSSGSSGTGGNYGNRVLTGGYAEGGYTGQGGKYEAAGIVHRGEWVAPKWMLQQNPVTFANLERMRRSGSHKAGNAKDGFAEGGMTSTTVNETTVAENATVLSRLASVLEQMEANGIHANVVLSELQDATNRNNRFKKATSR